MKRLLLLLVLAFALAPRPVQAQVSLAEIFWLDPQDANSYAEFTRREYRIATKQDGPKLAAQIVDNQRITVATIPTPQTGQTPARFWSVDAPEWWKRVSSGYPGASASGQASQGRSISKFFEGLDSYQRIRSTLRATALMYQSLKGLRFELDAWQMMKNLLVIEEGEVQLTTDFDSGGTLQYETQVPKGAVSISVVPRGKEKWRQVVEMFADSPWDDPNHKLKWIGPTSLSGIAIDATEIGGDPTLPPGDAMQEALQKIDAGARVAAESLMSVQMGVDQRKRQALNDAFSPKRLAAMVRMNNKKILSALTSLMDLRSILEGRTPADIAAEYANLQQFADDQAKAIHAQAELTANFYQNIQGEVGNLIVELETPQRQAVISSIEKEYEALFNISSKQSGLIQDVGDVMRNVNQIATSLYPAMTPFIGGILMPIDMAATIKGAADSADTASKDPTSEIQATFRKARMQAVAVRMNWVLWEELRATRRLASMQEQVAAANHGLDRDEKANADLNAVFRSQNMRAAQNYRMQLAQQTMEKWGKGL